MDIFQVTQKILEQSDKGMALLDPQGIIRSANPMFLSATGLLSRDAASRPLAAYLSEPLDLDRILSGLGPEEAWQGRVSLSQTPHPPLMGKLIRIQSGQGSAFLMTLERCGAVPGTMDEVTGLPKIDIFLDRVEQFIRFSRRENAVAVMLLIRLDRFSLVTDGLGREQSELIVKEIALRLRQSFRESDTIARVDRDCFGLLLRVTQETHASLVAEKVLRSITRPVCLKDQNVVVTASIGIVSCHEAEKSAQQLMESAETAMHHAASLGGNTYHFFATELNDKARKRVEMENSLRAAVENGEFLLFYQPKVDIQTCRIVGAEALIRWQHPVRGMVPPLDFIPVAEETGLIIDIGRWVLYQACGQTVEWQEQGLEPVPMAVNVSPRQFQNQGFFEDVSQALKRTGLSPSLLELEITESMLMSDVDQVIQKLKKLAGVGLNLAIDDFGTGYSNLSYLVRFPVSTLKIDRTFIKDLEKDASMAGLTHSIIAMSKNLNLKIVAEGAENKTHIEFLKAHGCHVAQGYYYSKPVPAHEFARLLKAGKIEHLSCSLPGAE